MVKLSGLLGFVESEDSRFVDVVGLVLISVSLGPVVLYGLLSGRRVLDGSLGRASVGGGFSTSRNLRTLPSSLIGPPI